MSDHIPQGLSDGETHTSVSSFLHLGLLQEVVPELPSEGQTAVSQESGVSSGLGVSICYSGEWGVGTRVGGNGRTQRVAWAQPLCRGVMEGC